MKQLHSVTTDIHYELVEKSKQGSNSAQHQLYKLYAGAMFNICLRYMHTREESEDMLQESFTEAFMKLDSFRYESTFGAWIKRITVNKCINEIKRKKADLSFTDNIENYGKGHSEEEEDLPQLSVEMVKWAMNQLPNGSRLVFQLYLLEGYNHREIAEILNVSESNSKSQYMRAKRSVKELLKNKVYET